MATGLYGLRKVQMGLEVTPGTIVAATAKMMGVQLNANLDDRIIVQPSDERALLAVTQRSYTPSKLWQGNKITGPVTFEDFPYILEMAVKTGVITTVDTTAKLFTYAPSLTAANTAKTYTFEFGDNAGAYVAEYCFVPDFEVSAKADAAVMFSASLMGRQAAPQAFTGALTDRVVKEALGALTTLTMDDTGGTIGSTAITGTLIDWNWKLPAHFVPKRNQDGSQLFTALGEVKMQPVLTMTLEYNTNSIALRTKYTGETRQLVRLKATDPTIIGMVSATRYFQIDGAYKITKMDVLQEGQDGISIVKLTLTGEYDSTWAKLFEFQVQNLVTALP